MPRNDGLPRIAGRIFGRFLVTAGSGSLDDLPLRSLEIRLDRIRKVPGRLAEAPRAPERYAKTILRALGGLD